MNTEILKRLEDAISSTLIGNSKDPDCNVGAAICIIKDGKEVYRNEYGEADKENHIPMERNSIFRCYSMTKPITAVAVMTLVEKGVIALSDPVSNFIPSFKNQTVLTKKGYVPAKREVVIQDLLNMTAGLTYPDASFPAGKEMQNMIDKYYADVEAGNPISTYDLAVLIGEQPLEFQPGEGWRYGFCADDELEVWFDGNANWLMTENELESIDSLVPAVYTAFNNTKYSSWVVTDVYVLVYPQNPTESVIQVKQGSRRYSLVFSQDGGLLHEKDISNGDDTIWPPAE